MHINFTRVAKGVLAGSMIVAPMLAYAAVTVDDRVQAEQAMQEALLKAGSTTADAAEVRQRKQEALSRMNQAEHSMDVTMLKKAKLRRNIVDLQKRAKTVTATLGVDPKDRTALTQVIAKAWEDLSAYFGSYLSFTVAAQDESDVVRASIVRLLTGAGGQRYALRRSVYRSLVTARMQLQRKLFALEQFPEVYGNLLAEREQLLGDFHAAAGEYDDGKQDVKLSDAELAEIKRIFDAVEVQIRQMQSVMADYDARIRDAAERDLVAMGLKSELNQKHQSGPPRFIWPVLGRITAGFQEPSYKAFFGVAHKAVDISQPQGSSVMAAADGIVYHIQNGGARGYSYVLIGHRAGYATLYGHLSSILVAPGQEIRKGDIIGLSGGTPGTVGAGPMTTGAHLHFEVIVDGVHIDPRTVLP